MGKGRYHNNGDTISTEATGPIVTDVTDELIYVRYIAGQGSKSQNLCTRLLGKLGTNIIDRSTLKSMNSARSVERLISKRWPKLKHKAQNENDPERLVCVLEEIDDLLSNLELRIATQKANARATTNATSDSLEAFDWPAGDSEGDLYE